MKRRLIKKFNELYFKHIPNAKTALTLESTVIDFNKKSVECTQFRPIIGILSDLLQVQNNNIINSYSETLTDILWDLSEANVKCKKAYNKFPESVKVLCGHLNYLSNNSCFVGGCVRDILTEKTPHDYDFVTDVKYEVMSHYFRKQGYNVQEKGKQFLVLIVTDKDKNTFEIANFRTENNYTDGRHPDSVKCGDIMSDAQRR